MKIATEQSEIANVLSKLFIFNQFKKFVEV